MSDGGFRDPEIHLRIRVTDPMQCNLGPGDKVAMEWALREIESLRSNIARLKKELSPESVEDLKRAESFLICSKQATLISPNVGARCLDIVARTDWGRGEEDEANARLIVMAPELLLECDSLLAAAKLTVLHFRRNQVNGNFQGDDEFEAWTALNLAIRRAEP